MNRFWPRIPSECRRLKWASLIIGVMLLGLPQNVLAQTCPAPSSLLATMIPTPHKITPGPDRLEKMRTALAAGSYDAITLGDSIMQGWSDDRLSSALGVKTLNAGVGGDGTEHVLWWLQTMDWRAQSPRYVLVLIGTNDVGRSVCEITWGVRTVVAKAHALFPGARIIVTSILPRGEKMMEFADKISAVNKMLETGAASARYRFFDAHDAFLCDHQTPCALFKPDHNLHLTDQGYDRLTDLLRTFIAQDP